MEIILNGETKTIEEGTTLQGLLEAMDITSKMIIIEQNGTVIKKDLFGATPIGQGDRLEIIQMMGGG